MTVDFLKKEIRSLLEQADERQLRLVYFFATALIGDTATQEGVE